MSPFSQEREHAHLGRLTRRANLRRDTRELGPDHRCRVPQPRALLENGSRSQCGMTASAPPEIVVAATRTFESERTSFSPSRITLSLRSHSSAREPGMLNAIEFPCPTAPAIRPALPEIFWLIAKHLVSSSALLVGIDRTRPGFSSQCIEVRNTGIVGAPRSRPAAATHLLECAAAWQ